MGGRCDLLCECKLDVFVCLNLEIVKTCLDYENVVEQKLCRKLLFLLSYTIL